MVPRADIQRFVDELAAKFPIERVYLFGSQAHGTATEDSDVDLLVVMDWEGSRLRKSVELRCAAKRDFALDLVLIRPSDLSRSYQQLNPITRDAIDRGEVLFERRSTTVGA